MAESPEVALERDVLLATKLHLPADWARRTERPAGWLSLDAGDNDPARFWRHALAALDLACPGIGERLAPLPGPPAPTAFQGMVTALSNELDAQPSAEQALLVLDDYPVIRSQQVHDSLGFLLEHRPDVKRVVLASRSDPGTRARPRPVTARHCPVPRHPVPRHPVPPRRARYPGAGRRFHRSRTFG